jgi:hypothetical protein
MRHPEPAALALQAGGDLGAFARWRMERHLTRCERCREEVSAFEDVRQMLPGLAATTELPWNRLAAEMKANIRLGLEAGECVREHEAPARRTFRPLGFRASLATAGVALLIVTGILIESGPKFSAEQNVVQTAVDGIGSLNMKLMHPGADHVLQSASAQGSVGARYTDPQTGYFTVIQVDAQ